MKLPTFEQLPFVLRLVIDPVRACDLVDYKHEPDHTKVVPFLVICAAVVLKLLNAPLTAAELLIIMSASFGASMFRMFLRSKTVTATVSDTTSRAFTESKITVQQVLARRDAEEGIDPTHE